MVSEKEVDGVYGWPLGGSCDYFREIYCPARALVIFIFRQPLDLPAMIIEKINPRCTG